jgi:hypothetical protein
MGKKKAKRRKKSNDKKELIGLFDHQSMYPGYDPKNAPKDVAVWNADRTDWKNDYGAWYDRHGAPEPKSN